MREGKGGEGDESIRLMTHAFKHECLLNQF